MAIVHDIKLWATDQLYSRDSTVLYKLQNVVEDAYSSTSNYEANVTVASQRIDAPTEDPFASFTAAPCGSTNSYSGLLPWWEDKQSCSLAEVTGANLLVTDNSGLGGKANSPGRYSVAAGRQLTYLSSDPYI